MTAFNTSDLPNPSPLVMVALLANRSTLIMVSDTFKTSIYIDNAKVTGPGVGDVCQIAIRTKMKLENLNLAQQKQVSELLVRHRAV